MVRAGRRGVDRRGGTGIGRRRHRRSSGRCPALPASTSLPASPNSRSSPAPAPQPVVAAEPADQVGTAGAAEELAAAVPVIGLRRRRSGSARRRRCRGGALRLRPRLAALVGGRVRRPDRRRPSAGLSGASRRAIVCVGPPLSASPPANSRLAGTFSSRRSVAVDIAAEDVVAVAGGDRAVDVGHSDDRALPATMLLVSVMLR